MKMKNNMKKESKEKKIKINHHGFIPFIIMLSVLWMISVFLQIFYRPENLSIDKALASFGLVTQIITAIVVCILQIMGIAFSVQTNEFAGMKLYEYRELRKDKHFSFRASTVLSLTLLLINVVSYLFYWFFVCIGTSLCAFLFCVYIIYIETPLLMMKRNALLTIVKDQIISQSKQLEMKNLLQNKYINAIKYCICEKDIQPTYEWFKSKDDDVYNKKLLNQLLDIQEAIAFGLKNITDKKELEKTVDGLLDGTLNILNGSFDIIKILGETPENYRYHITRVLFQLMECDLAQKVIERICGELIWIDGRKMDPLQKKMYIDIMIILVSFSVKRSDFRLLSEIRKQFSLYYFTFDKGVSGLIFAIISFQLFYLVKLSNEAPKELRENITAFIQEGEKIGTTSIVSWKKLFEKYSSEFKLDYSEFIDAFRRNEDSLDYITMSGFAHWVVLSEKIASDWYIAHLLNKEMTLNDDYADILKDYSIGKTDYYLEQFMQENYKEGVFLPSEELRNAVSFFSSEPRLFDCFISDEKRNHRFYSFYEKRKKEKLDSFVDECNSISNEDLVLKYKPKVEAILFAEWGFDNKIVLDDASQRYIRFLYEKKSNAINHDEFIVEYISEGILDDIHKSIRCNEITTDNDDALSAFLCDEIQGITNYARHLIYDIKDHSLKDALLQKMTTIIAKSRILSDGFIVKKDGYGVNIRIDEFSVDDLSEQELNKMVDQYRRADGQYLYEGVFMKREDVLKRVKARYVIYTIVFRYKVKAEGLIRLKRADEG
ncbi:MAG: hypothetical protein K5753_04840 [Clostridia bacterium]|nr:hypothetical protein [Clostridia bacterium]